MNTSIHDLFVPQDTRNVATVYTRKPERGATKRLQDLVRPVQG